MLGLETVPPELEGRIMNTLLTVRAKVIDQPHFVTADINWSYLEDKGHYEIRVVFRYKDRRPLVRLLGTANLYQPFHIDILFYRNNSLQIRFQTEGGKLVKTSYRSVKLDFMKVTGPVLTEKATRTLRLWLQDYSMIRKDRYGVQQRGLDEIYND